MLSLQTETISFIVFYYFPLVNVINFFLFVLSITYSSFLLHKTKQYYLSTFIPRFLFFLTLLFNTFLSIFQFFIMYLGYLTDEVAMFGYTIKLLCLLTTFIALLYLSERGLLKSNFNIFYFFIFFLATEQMTSTTNYLIILFYFELLFLPSLFFVYYLGYSKKVDITVSYLLKWTFSGSLIVLLTLLYIYSTTLTADLLILREISFTDVESSLLGLLLFLGFGIKLPIWPFYYWLTKVHVEAPSGFSIFLSGFLVKTALYCFSFFLFLFKNPTLLTFMIIIAIWGSVDASIRMWTSNDIKRLIAFATVQEMNLILLLLLLSSEYSLYIVNLFLLVHGVLSSLLFFLIDQIQKQLKTRNLTLISGISLYAKSLTLIIWLSILIFRGFPLFIKFFIEWELLLSSFLTFKLVGFFFFLSISFFSVLGFCRIWFIIIYGTPQNIISFDILKKDHIIASYLILILFLLNFVIFIFNCHY